VKVKTKILILIVGNIIIPVFVTMLAGYINMMISEKSDKTKMPSYFHTRDWIDHRLPEEYKRVYPDLQKIPIPPDIDVALVDTGGAIVLSNIPGLATGALLVDAFKPDQVTGTASEYIIRPFVVDNRIVGQIFLRLPFIQRDRPGIIVKFFRNTVYAFIAIILFSAVMMIFIINSLNRSIGTLETATEKIASGELDFELRAETKDEIGSLTRSFEKMRRQLKENNAQRSRFLMAVSHDLKTPLTAIWGYIEAITDGLAKSPELLSKYMDIIYSKSKVLEERILQILDFSKMETGEWQKRFEPIDLYGFLTRITHGYREDAAVYGKEFITSLDIEKGTLVMGDEKLLSRAFDNLFSNALRYTGKDDVIELRAFREGEYINIFLKNTGTVISTEEIEHIFEPFYRGTNSRNEPGTGLGLSIVRSILSAHGWEITARSIPDSGTQFCICIKQS
jgi:signal transduction histidine kinase